VVDELGEVIVRKVDIVLLSQDSVFMSLMNEVVDVSQSSVSVTFEWCFGFEWYQRAGRNGEPQAVLVSKLMLNNANEAKRPSEEIRILVSSVYGQGWNFEKLQQRKRNFALSRSKRTTA
jgi:hypothetical protein